MNTPQFPSWLRKIFPSSRLTMAELQASAERQGPEAQTNLGILHTSCEAFHGNDVAGAQCFRAAADRGYALAQYNLGLMYERGCGVIRNASESRAWFLKAAEQGDAGAQFHLGMSCHRETFDPARTDSVECKIEALKWLLMAAAQEYQNAEASCNGLILKMSHEELAESNRRMAALRERMQMALPGAEPLTHS